MAINILSVVSHSVKNYERKKIGRGIRSNMQMT